MPDLEEMTAVTPKELAEWYTIKKRMVADKATEAMMRTRIFKFFFPTPDEGTNTHPLKDGTGAEIKAVHTIDRKVDEGELQALKDAINAEGSNLPKFDFNELIVYKPELKVAAYRKLSEEDQAIFDRCLVVKPGMPQVDIKIPAKAKK